MRLFYSYSHKDEALRDELEAHLSILQRQKIIESWHDRRIRPGSDWEASLRVNLNSSNVILLLVSADFLASDYCYGQEIQRALELHESGTAIVIPVILRACDWLSAPFGKIQVLPKDGKPVTSWPNRDEAWADVARGIRSIVSAASARDNRNINAERSARELRNPSSIHDMPLPTILHDLSPPTTMTKARAPKETMTKASASEELPLLEFLASAQKFISRIEREESAAIAALFGDRESLLSLLEALCLVGTVGSVIKYVADINNSDSGGFLFFGFILFFLMFLLRRRRLANKANKDARANIPADPSGEDTSANIDAAPPK